MGESQENPSSISAASNAHKELSKNYSTIGSESLKVSPVDFTKNYYVEYVSTDEIGKTVEFTIDAYSNQACVLKIYSKINSSYTAVSVSIPANTPGTYTITTSISSQASEIRYRCEPVLANQFNGCFYYTTNWRIRTP